MKGGEGRGIIGVRARYETRNSGRCRVPKDGKVEETLGFLRVSVCEAEGSLKMIHKLSAKPERCLLIENQFNQTVSEKTSFVFLLCSQKNRVGNESGNNVRG